MIRRTRRDPDGVSDPGRLNQHAKAFRCRYTGSAMLLHVTCTIQYSSSVKIGQGEGDFAQIANQSETPDSQAWRRDVFSLISARC